MLLYKYSSEVKHEIILTIVEDYSQRITNTRRWM